jgi:hypothetical protein
MFVDTVAYSIPSRSILPTCLLVGMLFTAAPAGADPDARMLDAAEDCPGVTLTVTPDHGEPGTGLEFQIANWPVDEEPPIQPITIRIDIVGQGEDLTLVQGPTDEANFSRYGGIPAFGPGDYTVEAARLDSSWEWVVCATAPLVIEGPPPTTTTAAPATTTTTTTTVPPTTTTTVPPTTTTTVPSTTTTVIATTTTEPAATETTMATTTTVASTIVAVDETPEDDDDGSLVPWLIALIAVIGVITGAGIGWWMGRRRADRPPASGGDTPTAPPVEE